MDNNVNQRLGRSMAGAPPMTVRSKHDDERQDLLAETFTSIEWHALSDLERAQAYDLVDGLLAMRFAARVRTGS